jgi:hypothetical protein
MRREALVRFDGGSLAKTCKSKKRRSGTNLAFLSDARQCVGVRATTTDLRKKAVIAKAGANPAEGSAGHSHVR